MPSDHNAELRKAVTDEFTAAGFPVHLIESTLAKQDRLREEEDAPHPIWIRIHRVHLLPDTLIAYGIGWDWDEEDQNYFLIKQWISEEEQEMLFEHTRRLRESTQIRQTTSALTELKVNDPLKKGARRARVKNWIRV